MSSKLFMTLTSESGRIPKGGVAFTINDWATFKSILLAPISIFSLEG